jgi:M6 family metalloprotease-like protein
MKIGFRTLTCIGLIGIVGFACGEGENENEEWGGTEQALTKSLSRSERLRPGSFGVRHHEAKNGAWLTQRGSNYVNIPRGAVKFVAATDRTHVAISFSADTFIEGSATGGMRVRALVDGQVADPGSVAFAKGAYQGTRQFVFGDYVQRGIHTVQLQWKYVGGNGQGAAKMRNSTIRVEHGPSPRLFNVTQKTPQYFHANWTPVVGMSRWVKLKQGDRLTFSVSAESLSQTGTLRLRALMDGIPAASVVFTGYVERQARTWTYSIPNLAAGYHYLEIQAQHSHAQPGTSGVMSRRSLSISAFSGDNRRTTNDYFIDSAADDEQRRTIWQSVPSMRRQVTVPPNGELAVQFNAEAYTTTGKPAYFRLVVDGVPQGAARLYSSSIEVPDNKYGGTRAVTSRFGILCIEFAAKHLNPGRFPRTSTVEIQWRVAHGGRAILAGRSMRVMGEVVDSPDLAESPRFGLGNSELEPMTTQIPLLLVKVDGRVADSRPRDFDIRHAITANGGVADFFGAMSGGRFSTYIAKTIGWYQLAEESDYYHDIDCDAPDSRGHISGGRERWLEALEALDNEVDYSIYDKDGDGVLKPTELGIVIVSASDHEHGVVRNVERCSNAAQGKYVVLDGVRLTRATQWTTQDASSMSTLTHELAHLLLNLNDMYNYKDVEGQPRTHSPTDPRHYSLMSENWVGTPHIDAMNKLALGWVTPVVVDKSRWLQVTDVKDSATVYVLPRLGSQGKEYFLLENRQPGRVDDPLFDEGLPDEGLAVWHIIDPDGSNASVDLATPPMCSADNRWLVDVDDDGVESPKNNVRRGVRLVRPFQSSDSWPRFNMPRSPHLWSSRTGSALDWDANPQCTDADAGVLGRSLLRWADGTASGYQLSFFGNPDNTMWVRVDIQ